MPPRLVRAVTLAVALASATAGAQSLPAEPGEFTVGDIKVEGLQRIAEGTVYNYLPVSLGDRMTHQKVEEALRALFATGFFRDVELRRDGSTLVVSVRERPSIDQMPGLGQ